MSEHTKNDDDNSPLRRAIADTRVRSAEIVAGLITSNKSHSKHKKLSDHSDSGRHLMLRKDVIDTCATGRFTVYLVAHINEGITLLTAIAAGDRGPDGAYPPGSINRRADGASPSRLASTIRGSLSILGHILGQLGEPQVGRRIGRRAPVAARRQRSAG
jgi:hypothetical protein